MLTHTARIPNNIWAIAVFLALVPGMAGACGWWGDSLGESDDAIAVGPSAASKPDISTPEGMEQLSTAYRLGRGVPQDDLLARLWAKRAALAGYVGGMNDYGQFLEVGIGGPVDDQAAAGWYEKAALRGNAGAAHSLANMYFDGRGVPRDAAMAQDWLRRAAATGHPSAAAQLGKYIWLGKVKAERPHEGCYWWLVALTHGGAAAGTAEQCFTAEPDLTQADLDRLRERAAALRPDDLNSSVISTD